MSLDRHAPKAADRTPKQPGRIVLCSGVTPKIIIVAAFCLLAAKAAAQERPCSLPAERCRASPDPAAAFLTLWNGQPDRAGWRMLVSPGFPQRWPPPAPGPAAVVRYAYAMRLQPGLTDGAEMAAPWARSTLAADGSIQVERMSATLHPLGIQGVRPLLREEIALAGREQEVAERLHAGGGQATDEVVRASTCGWVGRQGVVAAAIMPLHPEFTRWLACP